MMSPFDDMVLAHDRVLWEEQQRAEIERAIDNVKRSDWDKWFRRMWYRAAAVQRAREWGLGSAPPRAERCGAVPRRCKHGSNKEV
jgi:hypothetical protein